MKITFTCETCGAVCLEVTAVKTIAEFDQHLDTTPKSGWHFGLPPCPDAGKYVHP